jgi:hypothetical protein
VQRLFLKRPMICGWVFLVLLLGAIGQARSGFVAPLAFDAGREPTSVAVGDFNGDGHLDLTVANLGENTVSVLLGNDDGTFQAARNFPVGGFPRSLAVKDFNGDGILDLAVANCGSNTVSVLLGNGDGTAFEAMT